MEISNLKKLIKILTTILVVLFIISNNIITRGIVFIAILFLGLMYIKVKHLESL